MTVLRQTLFGGIVLGMSFFGRNPIASADLIQADVTLNRIITYALPAAGQTVNAYGSAQAAANADGNSGPAASNDKLKASVSGPPLLGGPPSLSTFPVSASEGPLFSPSSPLNSVQASSSIDLSNSHISGPNVTIASSQNVQVTLNHGAPVANTLTGSAQTLDPLTFGIAGLGSVLLPPGSQTTQTVTASGVASLQPGSRYDPLQMIAPGAFSDPDNLFISPPIGATMMWRLFAENTGATTTVTFIPGTSNANFQFDFNASPATIEARFLSYLNGGGDQTLFSVTTTILTSEEDVTMYNQDNIIVSLPEPSTGGLVVLALSALILKRWRRSRQPVQERVCA